MVRFNYIAHKQMLFKCILLPRKKGKKSGRKARVRNRRREVWEANKAFVKYKSIDLKYS